MDQKTNNQRNKLLASQSTPCSYCASPMPKAAKVCPICHYHRNRWFNYLRVDNIGLLIALGIMVISYLHFAEARKDRVEAGEALERAKSVETDVISLRNSINSLHKAAEQGVQNVADILAYVRSLQEQIDKTRKELEKMDKRLGEIPQGPTAPLLKFVNSRFDQTASGLRGTIIFQPTANASLSVVEFKVTVLPGSIGRIMKISPAIPISLMVTKKISADGKQAHLKYTVVGTSKPSFSIELTGSAKLCIEGKPGIKAFEIDAD